MTASPETTDLESAIHAPLRHDIRLLGDLLGETLREQAGESVYQHVEQVRSLAKTLYEAGAEPVQWQSLEAALSQLSNESLLSVTRAFSHFFNYVNIAEQCHRVRRRRAYETDPAADPHVGSVAEIIPRLLNNGIEPNQLVACLSALKIELVLTAHPTQVARRTLLRKYDDIYHILNALDRPDLSPIERQGQLNRLKRRIIAAWQTDEIRHHKPSPVDEAKWGFATVESTLWQALPDSIRLLDNQLLAATGQRLPVEVMPIGFATWMGGDRDGNPFVTAEVTREVLLLARWQAADLLLRDIVQLRQDLSMQACNAALREVVGPDVLEPYRVILREIRQRLEQTRNWAESCLQDFHRELSSETLIVGNTAIYTETADVLRPLELMYQSLLDCNMEAIAQGTLLNVIRCVRCFGLGLLKLDIRQDASRHAAVLAALCEYLEIRNASGHGYLDWSELEKQQFLLQELTSRRPLFPADFSEDADVQEVLATFKLLATQPAESLGAYVISMAKRPSDVLAVKLLQQEMQCHSPQRIVPLFETLEDLNNAADTLEALLKIDYYRQSILGEQEVMIGYSDSAKGAGFFAAAWAQYQAQEQLLAVCEAFEVRLTFFHGRGGSVSRGGGPAHAALLSQPPGCLQGRVRVTEQGEVIQHKFGNLENATRTLELYLSATMEATLAPPDQPLQSWRAVMQHLADISVKEYRQIIYETPAFIDYFKTVTPESELQKLPMGSRPAKRRAVDSVQSLRAIPWVFAWTQSRLMLPAWLGVGYAFCQVIDQGQLDLLKDMRAKWPYFRMLMDMQEMVMAKIDLDIFRYYQDRLLTNRADSKQDVSKVSVSKEALIEMKALGDDLLARVTKAIAMVGEITEQRVLSELPVLQRSIALRKSYLMPLHLVQVELMCRLRDSDDALGSIYEIEKALMVSIAGIAAGLRNTG